MNNGVDLVLSKKKKKKGWENVLGHHNQIFHFGLINKKKEKKSGFGFGWIFIEAPNQPR